MVSVLENFHNFANLLGQYFKFINELGAKKAKFRFLGISDCRGGKISTDYYTDEHRVNFFEFIIEKNNLSMDDDVYALGDYGIYCEVE